MAEYPSAASLQVEPALAGRLAAAKEAVWLRIGALQSAMNDRERALDAFERVLAVNPSNVRAMTQAGAVLAKKECYSPAVEYLQRAIRADATCGEAWAVLAHCYVMTDELQKAYQAYQSALSHLPNPRDPNLWYGIGLLYDRYGSLDHALEAFRAVLTISPDFERADEVCFCIGIIYKEQQNFDEALNYFKKVVVAANPPPPLTRADGWYQIGHVNELKSNIAVALDMYKRALSENPKHPKTLQNYGWLEHQHNNNSTEAIRLLKLSSDLDPADGQTWYLLGRVYMALREFRQAYDAYQQAVYRDGRNATFWCSIGVLYYQMNQYRDAMDAYSRAIRLNPYVSEVWYDLGTLYESCGQNPDAIDAYRRAAELAPDNTQITARLAVLESSMNPGSHPQTGQTLQSQHAAQQGPRQQLHPQQMQPDMHHPGQQHMPSQLNPALNGPMGGALQQLPQGLSTQKLSHHQGSLPPSQLQPPTHQMSHPSSVGQPQNSTALSGSQRSGHVELAAIPSLRPQDFPQSQPIGHGAPFSQDGRPSLPAPLSGAQLSAQTSSALNQLSPMMTQGMHTQQQSSMVAAPGMGASQPTQDFRHRTAPLPHSHLQPLNRHESLVQRPLEMSHLDSQQQPQHPQAQMSHIGMSQSQSGHQIPQSGQNQLELQRGPRLESQPQQHHSSSHMQTHDSHQQQRAQHLQPQQQHPGSSHHHLSPQSQSRAHHASLQQQEHSPQSQGQNHRQLPQQQVNTLPQIQALPQLPALSHMQQQQMADHQKSRVSQQQPIPGLNEPHRHGAAHGPVSGHSSYMPPTGDQTQQRDYGRMDEGQESRFSKIPKSEPLGVPGPFQTSSPEHIRTSQSMFASSAAPMRSGGSPARHIPSGREQTNDHAAASGPSRSMGMHEVVEEDGLPRRGMDENVRNDRDTVGRDRQEEHEQDQNQNRSKTQLPERLPAMNSFSGPMQTNSAMRESREDANLLTSVATSGMAVSSPGAGTMRNGEGSKLLSSSHGGPSRSPRSSPMRNGGAPIPPMSSRNSAIGGLGQEPNDHSAGMGLGVSSLTQFGKARTPATPVNNSVAPSSLPSPLPARKDTSNGTVAHARSPRLSKPGVGASFKTVSLPPPRSAGQVESVPSPSSLPVLPALSSQPGDGGARPSPTSKGTDCDGIAEDGEGLSDPHAGGSKSEEKDGNDSSGGLVRKPEDGSGSISRFGMLRSAPAPVQTVETDRNEKDKSPAGSASRHDAESSGTYKRDSSPKNDRERSAKRPRLQESDNSKTYSFMGEEKKNFDGNDSISREHEVSKGGTHLPAKSDIPSLKDLKADMRASSNSQPGETDKSRRRDSSVRSSDGDGGRSLGMGGQVIDFPRLSTPMPKPSGPPSLAGNTPLPSFRSERRNLSAARTGGGSGSGGKSTSQDNTSRSSLPFALRSAPVTSIPTPSIPQAPLQVRSALDHSYGARQSGDESGVKHLSEDKQSNSPKGGSGPREETGIDRLPNGDIARNASGASRDHEGRRESELNAKDDKQSGRTEIHSGAP